MNRRTIVSLAAFSLSTVVLADARRAEADSYPNRPVRIIAAIPPGSANDVIARVLAQRLSQRGGQYLVENMPGAGGTIGTGTAARAAADGYNLLIMNQDFVIQPLVKSKVPYDPFKSFSPISLTAAAPEVIVVHPSVPAKTMKELVDLLKANPGRYSYASPGHGTSPHLASERLFRLSGGADVLHVPFQGGAPAVASTVGGHTQILHITLPLVAGHIKDGTLRPIALAADTRSRLFPDVPTLSEAGFPGHDVAFWTGLVAPTGTPTVVIDHLNRELAIVLALPELKERFAAIGFEPTPSSPADLAKRIESESALWSRVVRDGKITID
jgi:tripartite-type tricarboxylate transporter receptor subunit TctC